MIINTNYNFLFYHIPKCAGTSIRTVLKGLDGNLKLTDPKEYKHTEIKFVLNRIPNFENLTKFTVVRNPWDRLHSLYVYIIQRFPSFIKTKGQTEWHIEMYEEATRMSFNEWVLNTDYFHCLEKKYVNTPITINKKSQLDYIRSDDGELLIDNIFKFEEMNLLFEFLQDHGIPLNASNMEHLNQTKRRTYKDAYTKKARKHVEQYFKDDIEMFDYKFKG